MTPRATKAYIPDNGTCDAASTVDTMRVRVVDRSGWGTSQPYPAIQDVEISVLCPVCGGRRGTPYNHNFHEDGHDLACDRWDNPCGHVDMYTDVIAEARALRANQGGVRARCEKHSGSVFSDCPEWTAGFDRLITPTWPTEGT